MQLMALCAMANHNDGFCFGLADELIGGDEHMLQQGFTGQGFARPSAKRISSAFPALQPV
jgi:hypothetical protein